MSSLVLFCFILFLLCCLWIIDYFMNKYRSYLFFLPKDFNNINCNIININKITSINKGFLYHCSHRGSCIDGAENSIEGLLLCLKSPIESNLIEFDVRKTKDNKLILLHDNNINRTTNGNGNINKMLWNDIKHLDAGYYHTNDNGKSYPLRNKGIRIPLLIDLLKELKLQKYSKTILFFDIKDINVLEQLLHLIKEYNIENQCILGSVDDKINLRIRQLKPNNIPSSSSCWNFFIVPILHFFGLLWLYPIKNEIYLGLGMLTTSSLVRALHYRNIRVAVFQHNKNNDTKDWHKYCIKSQVDFILTDYPEVLRFVLNNKNE